MTKVPISWFVDFVKRQIAEKAGYIIGSYGQDPKKWAVNSWWFTQYDGGDYTAAQKAKALYWRENAKRVFDCQGLAEGAVLDYTGVNVNTKARYNYSGWCSEKGAGMIPADKRVPGMAVFWGRTAGGIHHVAYLLEPVDADNPAGDWYIGEARGVMYGCVQTRLYERKPNFWGRMDKYFDYGEESDALPDTPELGEITLLRGMMDREDVKQMQQNLIKLGYDLGKYGADGDFGADTETAVRAFQTINGLDITGQYDAATHAAMMKAEAGEIHIEGGDCWVRAEPGLHGKKLGVACAGDTLTGSGEQSGRWLAVVYKNRRAWVSGKYGRRKDG